MRQRSAALFLCLCVTLAGAAPARAGDPFGFSDLFFGRSIQKTTKSRRAELGLRFSIAPVKAVMQHEVDGLRQQVAEQCPECNAVIDQAIARHVTPQAVRTANSPEALRSLIEQKAGGTLSADEQLALDNAVIYLNDHPTERDQLLGQSGLLAEVVDAYTNRDGVAFGIEPYAEVNFKWLQLGIAVPLAGFFKDTVSDFALGNIGLDARIGHHFGEKVSFGVGYGLSVNLPSGTGKADTLGLSNMLYAPRFLHEYMTVSPFVTLGLDLRYVSLLAHAELFNLMGVRGGEDYMGGLHYGVAAMLTLFDLFALNVEFDGFQNVKNAAAFNSLFLTAGVRFKFWIVKPSAAVQIPLATEDERAFGRVAGLALGSPAKFNVIVGLGFEF